ncbi:hypothetical protein PUNSTDRAFT_133820 [Punctularia strigosozonata HHB-11173 SS5]|uniref:uncharacterized protein n=1 Tax=Punctularia strigosozonata (strain HHB-11173) TaxID=741275 RepID=UPI00044172B4|nr:uncharacterized protein PUNSTDRAFT_133820 [Punctularia strigosozonata HHB-11173 SS5]EIN10053.1 hypothetical protein PUNSTDRAFT_133820 [Punctularia strigosozonata HHB-11173 SS5]
MSLGDAATIFQVVNRVKEHVELVSSNEEELTRIANILNEIAEAVSHSRIDSNSSDTQAFNDALSEVQDCVLHLNNIVRRQAKRSWLAQQWKAKETAADLDALYQQLQICHNKFQLRAAGSIAGVVHGVRDGVTTLQQDLRRAVQMLERLQIQAERSDGPRQAQFRPL